MPWDTFGSVARNLAAVALGQARPEARVRPVRRPSLEGLEQRLVSPLTKPAMNSGHVWRTTDASSDSSRSTQRGGHSDGCILARKPTHGS